MSAQPASQKRIRHSGTAYKLMRRLRERILDRASQTVQFKMPLDTMTAFWLEIAPQVNRLGRYAQGYLWAVHETTRERIVNEHAEWRITWRGQEYHPDHGRFAYDHAAVGSKARPSSEIITGTWNEVEQGKGRHVWAGSDRPFYSEPATLAGQGR